MNTIKDETYAFEYAEQRKIDFFIPDAPNGACLLFIHGGGWGAGNKEQWQPVAEHFARLGYVCASASYRLAPDYQYPSQIEDARLAMQYVKRQADRFGFRSDAVGVVGSSAGGHLAAMLGTIADEAPLGATAELEVADTMPQLVICYCPVVTLFLERGFIQKFMGATAEEQPERFREASPLYRVGAAPLPPFLFLQGDQDPTTPLRDTSEMCHAINSAGGSADLVVLPGVKHGFGYGDRTEAQQVSLAYVELFLNKHGLGRN